MGALPGPMPDFFRLIRRLAGRAGRCALQLTGGVRRSASIAATGVRCRVLADVRHGSIRVDGRDGTEAVGARILTLAVHAGAGAKQCDQAATHCDSNDCFHARHGQAPTPER